MFEPEKAIAAWRARLCSRRSLTHAHVAELESHLRDELDALSALPLSSEECFLLATHRLGDADSLAAEFFKNARDAAADAALLKHAGFHQRIAACVFDTCIVGLAVLLLFPLAASLAPVWAAFLLSFAYGVVGACTVGMIGVRGATPGMLMAGIRICRRDGSAISHGQALLRMSPLLLLGLLHVVLFIQEINGLGIPEARLTTLHLSQSVMAPTLAWIAVTASLFLRNPRARLPHDWLAGTLVVDAEVAKPSACSAPQFITA